MPRKQPPRTDPVAALTQQYLALPEADAVRFLHSLRSQPSFAKFIHEYLDHCAGELALMNLNSALHGDVQGDLPADKLRREQVEQARRIADVQQKIHRIIPKPRNTDRDEGIWSDYYERDLTAGQIAEHRGMTSDAVRDVLRRLKQKGRKPPTDKRRR